MSEIADLAGETIRVLDQARYVTRATDEDAAWSQVGSIADYLHRILDLSADPEPPPTPPVVQFVCPVPNGGVLGPTKWLPGSLGCDVFLPRGTQVVAPADCVVEEVIPGQGISGGAELIIALPDRSWAWRWRHVQAKSGIRVGYRASQGQPLATIYDTSLDQLGRVPAWAGAMPDGWQHLDLSVDQGTDQFAPTGGGGGNTSAYQWLVVFGYTGRVLSRTPGPPDAGFSFAEARRMMGRPT